ncbi:MAG: SDR family oxidoreductase [bacterium]
MTTRDMEGKVALVAAGSRGLGRASALAIARRGANVAICSRDGESAGAAAEAIAQEAGVETWHCSADLSTPEGPATFVGGAAERFGGVDVLVSNAGGPPRGEFVEFDDAAWQRAFELGVMSAIRLVRETLPHMKNRDGGRIIFILSSSVREPIEGLILSNVMRPAVAGLAKTLSRELAPEKILVNVVAPGTFLTDRVREGRQQMADKEGITLEELLERVGRMTPLGRMGDPAEFASMVAFLASPESSFISGGVHVVDGGRLRGI